jgi:hypothetical protein
VFKVTSEGEDRKCSPNRGAGPDTRIRVAQPAMSKEGKVEMAKQGASRGTALRAGGL